MAQSRTEFELKLVGSAPDVAALPHLAWLGPISASAGEWRRLSSTYYDSGDARLAQAGLSLRIYDEADGRSLTAKLTPPGGAAISRLECERAVDADDIGFATGDAVIDRLVGDAADLAPAARVTVYRWFQLVRMGGALIEVSAEHGVAESLAGEAASSAPFAEVELELLKGDPAALFEFANRLIAEFNGRLRIGLEAKVDRARRGARAYQLTARAPAALAPDTACGEALAAILKPIAARIIEAAAIVVERRDSDAAKALRVALRRLRAAERAFRPMLAVGALSGLAETARDLARCVGAARDLDHFIAESLPLAPAPALRAQADTDRARSWNDVVLALSTPSFGAFTVALLRAAWLSDWRRDARKDLDASAKDFADAMLERRFECLKSSAVAAGFANPEALHALRLDLKRFRYAAQFFRGFYDQAARKASFAAMSALQDALGAVSDADVASSIANRTASGKGEGAARAAGLIAGYHNTRAIAAAAAAKAQWEGFAATAPFWRSAAPAIEAASTDDP